MAINKVVYGARTLIDITDSTVTPETLAAGAIAYNNAGERIVGTMASYPDIESQGNWRYRIYQDNTFEAWYKQSKYTTVITATSGNLYRSDLQSLPLPSNIYDNYNIEIQHAEVNCSHNNYPTWGMLASLYDKGINFYAMSGSSRSSSPNYLLTGYVMGKLTEK